MKWYWILLIVIGAVIVLYYSYKLIAAQMFFNDALKAASIFKGNQPPASSPGGYTDNSGYIRAGI